MNRSNRAIKLSDIIVCVSIWWISFDVLSLDKALDSFFNELGNKKMVAIRKDTHLRMTLQLYRKNNDDFNLLTVAFGENLVETCRNTSAIKSLCERVFRDFIILIIAASETCFLFSSTCAGILFCPPLSPHPPAPSSAAPVPPPPDILLPAPVEEPDSSPDTWNCSKKINSLIETKYEVLNNTDRVKYKKK